MVDATFTWFRLIVIGGLSLAAFAAIITLLPFRRTGRLLTGVGVVLLIALIAAVVLPALQHRRESRQRHFAAAPTVRLDAQAGVNPLAINGEAWDELTRPRIQLDAPQEVRCTVIANGREITISDESDIPAALSQIEQIFQQDGQRLRLDFGLGKLTYAGNVSPELITGRLQQALSAARRGQPIGPDPLAPDVDYTVVVNGRELRLSSAADMALSIAKVHARWAENNRQLDLDYGDGSVSFAGEFQRDLIGDKLHVALQQARQSRADAPVVEAGVEAGAAAVAVAAADNPVAAAGASVKPEWVTEPPKRIGQLYRQVVSAGPFVTVDECYTAIGPQLVSAAQDFTERHLAYRPSPAMLQQIGINAGSLMRDVGVGEYVETVRPESFSQDMKQLYVLVEFDQGFSDRLKESYAAYQRQGAVRGLTAVGVSVLALIAGVLGLLKLDEATKGYYTKRLFIGASAAIIGLLLLLSRLS